MVNTCNIIKVTAAILQKDGKILIAKRKSDDELFGGLWEFPGGKLEYGETPEECLERELKEELEIEVKVDELIISNNHTYSHGTFILMAYKVDYISGEFILNVHDEIRWVTVDEMENYKFPPADIPIITYLKKMIHQ